MIYNNIKYCYNDLAIMPAEISKISHRSECQIFDENDMLPLFTAPMSCIVNLKNCKNFFTNGIYSIIPRNIDLNSRIEYCEIGYWSAFSLIEAEDIFIKRDIKNAITYRIVIDIANGHMQTMFDIANKIKTKYGNKVLIMAGNIANPETYIEYCKAGIDYVRVGIGSGNGCLTSTQTSIHYPMASLINEIRQYKEEMMISGQLFDKFKLTKIVADGGVRGYSDIIKALALGADYVMIGSVFVKMLESASICYKKFSDGNKYELPIDERSEENIKSLIKNHELFKEYYGMSTKKAQMEIGKVDLHTSEGTFKIFEVEYTMKTWIDNFSDYLRSAMSYCNCKNLNDFIGKQKLIPITNNGFNSFNK